MLYVYKIECKFSEVSSLLGRHSAVYHCGSKSVKIDSTLVEIDLQSGE